MAFLDVKHDTLIFTDADRVAGGIINAATNGRATIVTAPVLAALEAAAFEDRELPASLTALANDSNVLRLSAGGKSGAKDLLPGISLAAPRPAAAPVRRTRNDQEGVIRLGELMSWRPAGELRSRRLGSATVHFVVAPQSLRGKVRKTDQLSIVGFDQMPELRAAGGGCGACGTCGVCGICTLCAEVNAASGLAAAIAISALANLGAVGFATATAAARQFTPEQADLLRSLERLVPRS